LDSAKDPQIWLDVGFNLEFLLPLDFKQYAVSQKKQSKLFSSELCQISTNFDNFWHKDGQDNRIV